MANNEMIVRFGDTPIRVLMGEQTAIATAAAQDAVDAKVAAQAARTGAETAATAAAGSATAAQTARTGAETAATAASGSASAAQSARTGAEAARTGAETAKAAAEAAAAGTGIPTGGAVGQIIIKTGSANFATGWYTPFFFSGAYADLTGKPAIPTKTSDLVNDSGFITTAANGTVTSVTGTGTVSGLTLTGTVTASGSLTLGGTLEVVPSNFASQTANTFLAAPSSAAGVPTFRTIVAADIPTLNQNTTGSAATLTTARSISMTGDVAWTVSFNGSGNVTAVGAIQPNVVTNNDLVQVATGTIKGRVAAGTGDVQDLTGTQVTTLIDTFTATLKGAVPASGGGTVNFLRADGAWAAPAGGGTVTSVAASGGTTGLTFTGSPITTSGTLTLGGTLAVASGGTGATTLTSGYLLRGNGTSAVTASVVFDDGANIGIGVPNPKSRLHSAGAITIPAGQGLLGNLYFSSGWKYVGNGFGWAISESSGSVIIQIAPNNAAGADAAASPVGVLTLSATGSVTSPNVADAVGYKGLPQNSVGTAYTLAMADQGKHVYITNASSTVTVPTNASVAFPVGTTIVVVNNAGVGNNATISQASGVFMIWAGNQASGSRTLGNSGMATLVKVASDTWFISGVGLT